MLAKNGRGGGFTLCFNLFNHHLFFYYLRWLCAWPQISVTLLKLSVLPGACGSQHGHLDSRKPVRKETHSITSTQTQAHVHTHRRHINNPPRERFGLRHFLLFLSLYFFFHSFSRWSVKCPQIKINPLLLIKRMQPLDKGSRLTAGTMGGIRDSQFTIAWVLPTTVPVSWSTQQPSPPQ